jgi:hypothetical protein
VGSRLVASSYEKRRRGDEREDNGRKAKNALIFRGGRGVRYRGCRLLGDGFNHGVL